MQRIYQIFIFAIVCSSASMLLGENTYNPCQLVSRKEKIAQMLIVGFIGTRMDDNYWISRAIAEDKIGGVILFDVMDKKVDATAGEGIKQRNIIDKEQLKQLTQQLQQYASTPLFIAIDQEGGRVSRIQAQYGFEDYPSAEECAVKGSEFTFSVADRMAHQLHLSGINLNFAPVVDLKHAGNFIGDRQRCYSSNPATVGMNALAFGKAHDQNNVLWTLKHFPGHGSSIQDSHSGFVDITQTWNESELEPYTIAFSSTKVPFVMVGHIIHKKIDEEYPASLSQKWIQGYLRNRLSYQGVVITDDIQMAAIREHYTFEESVILAVNAGNDIVLINNTQLYDTAAVKKAIRALDTAVEEGRISECRIDEAYDRIMKLKARFHPVF